MNNYNIPFAKPILDDKEKSATSKVLNGHILTHGPMCKNFEASFGLFHNNINAITLSNCTSAMFLALKALGINERWVISGNDYVTVLCCSYRS